MCVYVLSSAVLLYVKVHNSTSNRIIFPSNLYSPSGRGEGWGEESSWSRLIMYGNRWQSMKINAIKSHKFVLHWLVMDFQYQSINRHLLLSIGIGCHNLIIGFINWSDLHHKQEWSLSGSQGHIYPVSLSCLNKNINIDNLPQLVEDQLQCMVWN